MRNMRSCAAFLCVVMILSLLPAPSLATGITSSSLYFEATGGKVYYTVTGYNTATIVGCDNSVTEVTIPATVRNSAGTDIPVTKIDMTAFDSHPNLETLSFADAVHLESIGNEAFENCTKLSSLTFGISMTLGNIVFRGCTSLVTVEIPEGWSNTFSGTFRDCTSLTSVILPSSLETIGTSAFENCTSLETVELPAGLEVIGSSAFKGCSALDAVTLPVSLKTINDSAFEGCTSLTGIVVPAEVTTVGPRAFSGCSSLTAADLSACEGLTAIGEYAFADNTLLEDIRLPVGLKTLGRDIFNNCDALVSIELPAALEIIYERSFYDCDSLASVTIPVPCSYISEYAFYSCDNLQTVSAAQEGHELLTISGYAFYKCGKLETVSLPASLHYMGSYAFAESGLKSITILTSLETLDASCFRDCSALEEVIFPEGISILTTINSMAFYGCTALESIELPACVETVNGSAFSGCTALESATMPGVKIIGSNAFYGCSALESASMPGVITIGINAFEKTGLTSISFPDSLTTIGSNAFKDCTSLAEIDWPSNEAFTTVSGFRGCTSLPESVLASIPSSVETIGGYAFYGCSFSSVMIPSGVTVVERFAFFECNNLRAVTIPETVAKLEKDSFSNDYYSTDQLTFTIYNPEIELEEFFTGARYVELRGAAKKANGEDSNIKQHVERMNTYYTSYHYTFTELDVPTSPPVYTVSGVIPNGAEVKVHRGAEEVTPTIEGNSFTAEVQSGESVSMTVAKVGYYSNTLYKTADEFNGDWDIGTVSLIKLPETGRFYVEITRSDNKTALPSFDKLTLILKKGEDEVEFTEAYPYIVITDDEIGDDDVLTLTVTPDNTLKLSPGTATSTREDGIFKLELPAWGNVSISAESEFAGNNIVLIFDNSGKLAEAGVAGGGSYVSGLLKNGNYKIVAYNASAGFSAVSSLAALADMGLTAGIDYSLQSVTVADKATAQVALNVPVFNTTPASIINPDDCTVIADKNTVVCGVPFNVRVLYSLTGDPSGGATVKISLTDGATLVNISNDSAIISVAPVGNTHTLSITEQQGAFYLYGITLSDPGVCSISASVTSGGVTAPLGSIALEAQTLVLTPAEIWLPEKTSSVNINCAPNTDVSLYVGNSTTSITATANARGRATITYTLPDDARSGQSFELRAESGGVSVTEKVFYAASDTRLMEFSFIHAGKRTDLIRNGQATAEDYYTYIANGQEINKHWTFTAVFESPDMTGNTVMLYITMMDESVRTETMTLIGDSAGPGDKRLYTYAADVYIEQSGDHVFRPDLVPVAFSVDWVYDQTDYVFDPVAVYNAALAEEEAREQVITDALGGLLATEVADLIFGRNYIVSNEEWFNQFKVILNAVEEGLGDETGEAFEEAEERITSVLDILSDIFDTPDKIYEYTDMDDFIMAAGDGMTAVGGGRPGVTYNVGQPIRSPEDITDMSSNILKTADGTQTGHVVTGSGWMITTNYTEEALDNAKLSAIGQAIGLTAESIDKLAGIYNTKTAYFLMDVDAIRAHMKLTAVSKTVSGIGAVFGVYTAKKNSEDLISFETDAAEIEGYIENLESHRNYYENHSDSRCVELVDKELTIARQLHSYLRGQVWHGRTDCIIGALFTVAGVITALPSGGSGSAAAAGANLAYDAASNTVNMARANEISILRCRLEEARRARTSECVSFDDRIGAGRNGGSGRRLKVKLDPSGIVYEALESNPLAGVTATIWIADDNTGTNAREWTEAASWDEVNPQTTGTDGAYAWDVPEGWWQVRFTGSGYNSAQTAWMQVPPPRMNLKTAMVSSEAPTVLSANAYTDHIEVIFSQYMDTGVLPVLPAEMTGAWQDVEGGFSKVLHILRSGGFTLGETVTLTISGAENYAGTGLAAYNSGPLTVTVRPAEIILNFDTAMAMKAGETPRVTVRVKDSDGNYMPDVTVNASVANTLLASIDPSAVTDADGKAMFSAGALLPGLTDVTFNLNGTSLTKTLSLRVTVDNYRPARPTAQIGSTSFTAASPRENYITVRGGEKLTISAEPGVSIFYTTDDTCPCQNSASRNIYTAPISLTANTKYRIAAYRDGMEYSERLNITVTIASGGSEGPIAPPPSGDDEEPITPPVWVNPFKDIAEDAWYYEDVAFVHRKGLLTGTGEDTFSPTAPVTRGMLVTVLYRLEGEPAVSGGRSFADVDAGKWYENAVIWAAQNRISEGYDDMRFGPEDDISREQMAAILWRYAKYKGYDMTAAADLSGFNDYGEISSWALEAMCWANSYGLINGKGGVLDPKGNAERCQVAAILHRFYTNFAE